MPQEDVPIAFFSYCREDSDFALKLAEDLKVAGAQVWIDQLDIEPGTPWDRAVEAALTNSPRMLVVLSPVSVNSDNVRDEVSFALSRQKRVIPVLYRDCDVPFRLARLQHIDFRPDYARALSILLRALGVGHVAESHGTAAAAAVGSAVSHTEAQAEAEEQARQQKLEEGHRLAEQQAQLEEARKYAVEQSRLKRVQEAATEQAARELVQHQTEAELRARPEQPRREQRAAEQARLEEEARLAAERVRLAQQEQERREAEIKARQEQLRREEQESVERKSLVLEAEPKPKPAAAKPQSLAVERSTSPVQDPVQPAVPRMPVTPRSPSPGAVHEARGTPPQQPPATGLSLASPKYLAAGAALVVVLGLILFLLAHRGGPEKAHQSQVAETAAVQQPQPQAPTDKTASNSGSSPAASAGPASGSSQEPSKAETKAGGDAKVPANANNVARSSAAPANMNPAPNAARPNAASPASAAGASSRMRISQGVSEGMLMSQVAPSYPPLARSARVQGPVVLDVVIGKDGSVRSIKAESGHPLLVPAAIDAVKQWHYKPYKLDGKPIDFDTQVVVNFKLTN